MADALEGDPETLQEYLLADYLKQPRFVIRAMDLEEFQGWLGYWEWKKRQEEDG